MSEEIALFVSNKWLEHLGYSITEIQKGEKAIDHYAFGCEMEGNDWFCFDENDISRHSLHDEVQTQIDIVREVLEIAIPKISRELAEKVLLLARYSNQNELDLVRYEDVQAIIEGIEK